MNLHTHLADRLRRGVPAHPGPQATGEAGIALFTTLLVIVLVAAVITAAALQIDANIPNFLIQESIYKSRHFFDVFVKEPFEWEDGYLIPPDRPGIGIELDEGKLEEYRSTIKKIFG